MIDKLEEEKKIPVYDILTYNESPQFLVFDNELLTLYYEKLLYDQSYIFILFLPFVNFVLFFSFHCLRFKNNYIFFLAPILIFFCFFCVVLNTALEWLSNPDFAVYLNFKQTVWWFDVSLFKVAWDFLFNSLSQWMLLVVIGISLVVHVYSLEYMVEDPNKYKFMSYLSLFTFFMILLVTGNNFLILFLGWEGVGLCSFLLISFWHTRVMAVKAAMKALFVNRIADFFLSIGIVVIYFVFKTLSFSSVFILTPFFENKSVFFFFAV